MRASRLVQLVLLLQVRGRTTADRLAEALEVSTRTVYRDVEALSAVGVPVCTESGPGGGIALVDGYQTRLTGLTGPEAAALGFAGVPTAAAQLGLEAALAAAQAKVDAALPAGLRAEAARVRERFLLDLPGWFDRPDDVPHLEALGAAVLADRRVAIRYRRGDGTVVRTLDPLGLVCKGGRWYLVASAAGAVRTYRVDRVEAVGTLDAPAERPPSFRLAVAWREAGASFARDLRPLTVRARLPAAELWRLRHALAEPAGSDAIAAAGTPDATGWCEVPIATESVEVAHDELLRLAPWIEVVDPPELRERMADTGRRLAARHGG